MFDILIKNGTVFDGSGKNNGIRTDIAVTGGQILAVKDSLAGAAREIINAEGLYVTPGFVDIQNHSDSHGKILSEPDLESLVAQGITTIAIGQCGGSLAPLPKPDALKSLQKWGEISGLNADWQTFAEFKARLSERLFGTNVISFVGHGNLRRLFTGDSARILSSLEIKQMAKLLEAALVEGGCGLSFGFQYAHEIKSTPEEILAMLAVLKDHGKIFSLHLRSYDTHFYDSTLEVVELAKTVGVKTKISHFKVEGQNNFPQLARALAVLEQNYQAGLPIRFDVYPYTTTWRPLYTYLPSWAYEGGYKPMLSRLHDKQLHQKLIQELSERRQTLAGLLVTASPRVSGFTGKTVGHIARSQNCQPEQALLNIISANAGQTTVFDHDVDPAEVTILLKHPLSLVASDGVGSALKAQLGADLPHPRCFGAMPRFLRLLREERQDGGLLRPPLLSWSEGIAKITGYPALFLGLSDRGLLKKGLKADIVVFDPSTVSDQATYANPFQAPVGIKYVINNGKISLYNGQLTGVLGGKLLTT